MGDASDQALWYWCIAVSRMKVEKFREQQNKVASGRSVYRKQNELISIWSLFWRVLESRNAHRREEDEKRTRGRRGKRKKCGQQHALRRVFPPQEGSQVLYTSWESLGSVTRLCNKTAPGCVEEADGKAQGARWVGKGAWT